MIASNLVATSYAPFIRGACDNELTTPKPDLQVKEHRVQPHVGRSWRSILWIDNGLARFYTQCWLGDGVRRVTALGADDSFLRDNAKGKSVPIKVKARCYRAQFFTPHLSSGWRADQ